MSDKKMTMAELLAKQDIKAAKLTRGQEVEGSVIAILPNEVILELGGKAEGTLHKKDLSPEQVANLKVGDKLITTVIHPESEHGQVLLGLQKAIVKGGASAKWKKFEEALKGKEALSGKGLEVNKGGLIVEVGGVRGFLPSSQVTLSQAANLSELVGKDIQVTVIEVDSAQNRLIFSQKANVSEDVKKKLSKLSVGEKVEGEVAAVLPFGIFVSLPDQIEGLVHVSELAWEKVDDPNKLFKAGDKVEAKVVSVDANTGRVNLSIKQLTSDPFGNLSSKFQVDDVIKAEVTKVSSNGVHLTLEGGVEGLIPTGKMDPETTYEVGSSVTCLVDSIDAARRRINLAPFITTTKGLIYK